MRCFIGIFLPHESQQIIHDMCPSLPNIRWTKSERYHITMKFEANLDPSLVPSMLEETSAISRAMPISCRATNLDGFPNRRRARVVIARIECGGILESFVDDSRFQPHVTVGYARKRSQTVPDISLDVAFELCDVRLVESKDGKYRTISE